MAITPKNWSEFQHYKDRAPQWIKLHRGLLDNMEYFLLSPDAAKALPLIWLLASENDGEVPDAGKIAFRLRIGADVAQSILEELLKRDFLVHTDNAGAVEQVATLAQRKAAANGFGSRHISDQTKRVVWERDGGKCRACGAEGHIEYDHVHPVSKGGNSEPENIQLLCRPCNRSKRVKVATPAQPTASDSRSLEIEKSNKKEQERDRERDARKGTRLLDDWRPSEDGKRLAFDLLGSEDAASAEFDKFYDYWRAIPGQRGVKLDWEGTWRNWCRRAADDFKNGRGRNGKRHDEARGNILPAAERLAEKLAEFDKPAPTFGGANQLCGETGSHPVRLLSEG